MTGGDRRNIILCGFMGTGKSSVGKRLAEMLGCDFVDLDAWIEAEAGMSISQIFASRGEPAFRALEAQMVERVAGDTGSIVAAGGGTIVDLKNLEMLKRSGIVITLTADVETILSRIDAGDDRPLLQGEDKSERIRILMEQRAQAYAKADIVIDTSPLSVDEVARRIIDRVREYGERRRPD
jgi:shikimate kinase